MNKFHQFKAMCAIRYDYLKMMNSAYHGQNIEVVFWLLVFKHFNEKLRPLRSFEDPAFAEAFNERYSPGHNEVKSLIEKRVFYKQHKTSAKLGHATLDDYVSMGIGAASSNDMLIGKGSSSLIQSFVATMREQVVLEADLADEERMRNKLTFDGEVLALAQRSV